MRQYRLLSDQPMIGSRNMAVDEAIMNAVIAGDVPPTLRFYAWKPACLSLGYGQHVADADVARIHARGWTLVRRPTGGRAILHTDELTYSLALPDSHPLAEGGIIESYRRISTALMAGLEKLGLHSHADRKTERLRDLGPVCFEVPSHYEITIGDGRKLIGSAQLRRKGGLLQHGTLPLHGDVSRICDGLQFPDDRERDMAKLNVRKRAATLQDALGGIVDWRDAVTAMIAAFTETFDIEWVEGALSDAEIKAADRLTREIYESDDWTFRR